jgi:hypothetical protein
MPCSECGEPLLASDKYENLRCPYCCGLDVVEPDDLRDDIELTREILAEDRVLDILRDYKKNNLLLYLINKLNQTAHQMYQTRGMQIEHFAYLSYLIKLVYPRDDFGDKELDPEGELADPIKSVLEREVRVLRGLNHIEDKSMYAVPKPVKPNNPSTFIENYWFYESEYSYCRRRNIRSLLGGHKSELDIYDHVSETIRDFDTKPGDEIETLEDFADTFFEFIIGISLMMSADETADDLHGNLLPDGIDTFDLKELINRLDREFKGGMKKIHDEGILATVDEAKLDAIGKRVFDDWDTARDALVLSNQNLDAHPYLFKIEYDKVVKEPPGRPPVTIDQPSIVYPRHYAFLLRFQLFPLMTEHGSLLGHGILKQICDDERGDQFEYNVYDYLTDEGYEAYHSLWYAKSDQREIDVLAMNESESELWFIECKYLLPELEMGRAAGIKALNKKFDSKVFPDIGESFPEKVDKWMESKPGDSFHNHGDTDRSMEDFRTEWEDYDVRMFVVSNLTPSYIEKEGVEFLTDMEFVEMVNGESNVFSVK